MGCSPYGGGAFSCTTDEQCGAGGRCESDHFCAFLSSGCPSGYKYGEASGPNSNQCVGGSNDGGLVDGPGSNIDTPPGQFCYGMGLVQACFAARPNGAPTLSSAIDTDTYACATVLGPDPGCVIAADSITVTGTVNVTGSRALVLVAVTTITVSGTLDVSSHRGGQQGAASDASTCNGGTAPTGAHDGGAGGSFGGAGGDGAGGAGKGVAGGVLAATSLHGGCPGQDGGGGSPGTHGHGGGAVYLIADGSIMVTGTIDASGAGATGGQATQSGGGGGGAGGMIGLDSPAITAGNIFANGGGGGEGGTAGGNPGGSGQDPMQALQAAAGGSGSSSGGDGGAGAAAAALAGAVGAPGTGGAGNGGGGGGAGVIKIFRAASITGGSVSPAP
jgi:hypothetical protein